MAQELNPVNKKLTKIYMAAKIDVPHDVILANQTALENCKRLETEPSFQWFLGILSAKLEDTIHSLAIMPLQDDKLTEGKVFALRAQLGLLMELADKDGNCPMLDEIAASAKLLQAPE